MNSHSDDDAMEIQPGGQVVDGQAMFVQLYDELRRLASARLAQEPSGQTLTPTALVNEVYLRLVGSERAKHWASSSLFFASAAIAMRRILVENARRKKRVKRGGDAQRVPFLEHDAVANLDDDDLLALDDALEELAKLDPIKARLVTMRYFGGMTTEQVCEVLEISRTTASRYWAYARAWLYRHITS